MVPVPVEAQVPVPVVGQAVVQVEDEQLAPGTVKQEFAKGYSVHDRVLRASMVSVTKDA